MFGKVVLDTADIVFFSNSNVSVKLRHWGEGVLPALLDLLVNTLTDSLLNGLSLFKSGKLVVNQVLASNLDRVTVLADFHDFILGSICHSWVRH